METTAEWHGTHQEWEDLADAAARHCQCVWNGMGGLLVRCPAHQLLDDQRSLDRLLFARRIASRLRVEERTSEPPWWIASEAPATPGLSP